MHYDMPLPGTITSLPARGRISLRERSDRLPPPGALLHPGTNASATHSLALTGTS